ncbi:hypothetical protein [uncultured Streptomyces sp.]|uniref:hypothetical protein n=1 Tax=uncultured Streptomyces sp. TaxID=174707 RepID=UPI002633656C|nr:hypothetical protein [uncultured Streptomyces sp.]
MRQRLRSTAEAHRPDRERMLARVERGMAEGPPAKRPVRPPRTPVPWLRVAGATVAVCAVLVLGAYAVTTAAHREPPEGSVAAPPAPRSVPTAPPTTEQGAPAGVLSASGRVDDGSNAYWAQSDLVVEAAGPLSTLTVELRIAETGGVNSTGAWTSQPNDAFVASESREDGFLVFRWTLKPGRTVPAGTHTFAGQYNHAEGARDSGADTFTVRGRPAGTGADGGGGTGGAAGANGEQKAAGGFTPE